MRFLALAWALCVAVSTGCNSSQSAASPPAVVTITPAAADPVVATGGLGATAGDSSSATAPASDTAKPPEPEKPKKPDLGEEPVHVLVAGLDNPMLVRRFQTARKQADEEPANWPNQARYIKVLQDVGKARMDANERDKSYATFAAAGDVARRFLATKSEVPEQDYQVLALAFYNDACAAAVGKDSKKALESLDAAVKWRFADYAVLEKDPDLDSLRSNPEFTKKLAGWKETMQQNASKSGKAITTPPKS